ncbi:MAG: hypothetical protein K2J77_09285 [Oscillospiraceae bacterium]|nr:hypothetical protein [Oscillospiraceae bacterium]
MDKKRKKHRMVIIIVASGLASAALFMFALYQLAHWFGSGGYRRIKTAPERAQFERLLEEKYGEEFVCFSTSTSGGSGFTGRGSITYARCAPVMDKTLVFEARKYPDNNELLGDNYAKNIAERQINEMMLPEISGMWESFAMYCDLGYAIVLNKNEDVVNKIREGEADLRFFLDELLKYKLSNNKGDTIVVTFTACFDDSTRNLSYEEEWEGFHKAAENFCASLSDYNIKVHYELFFSPSDRYNNCAGIVKGHYSGSTVSWSILEDAVNREIDETKKGTVHYYGDLIYHREIDIDTTHQVQNDPRSTIPKWFDTAEDYAEFRAEMKTENQGGS